MVTEESLGWRSRFPCLSEWAGADPRHPLAGENSGVEVLAVLEELVSVVETANPRRWQGRRRDFRGLRSEEALWAIKLELVVAAQLARAGVGFEFRDRPDVVVSSELGIEVTTRLTDARGELADDLGSLERRLVEIAHEKSGQGSELPTLLIVDVTRAGNSWLRPSAVWIGQLKSMLPEIRPFVGVAAVTTSYDLAGIRESAVAVEFVHGAPECWPLVASAFGWTPRPA